MNRSVKPPNSQLDSAMTSVKPPDKQLQPVEMPAAQVVSVKPPNNSQA